MDCIFCKIINKEISADILYEDENTLCFFPKKMEAYGHILVIPKKHYENIFDIPEEELKNVTSVIKMICLHIKENIGATGFNLLHASGKDAQQSMNHFHIHILPRFKDDGLDTWPKLKDCKINRKELLNKLKI